jgi:two-component system, NarL family, nitrate/nitrite response regulator NarL
MIRILIADSSRIHTRLLAEALTRSGIPDVIPFESNLSELVAVALAQNVDVLVISSKLNEKPGKGFEILRELRTSRPDIRAVLLLDSTSDASVLQAFRAGARGVFDKNDPLELLSKCVRCVYQGQIWANSRQLEVLLGALANSPIVRATNAEGMDLLSERELQVVRCLAEGLTNREIASRLHLSQHTVKNYLFRVFDKLGVSSRVELLSMTLTRSSFASTNGNGYADKNGYSPEEANLIEKSAHAGVPAAQLALAQMYLGRRTGPQDLVDAYMWYLIAIERANHGKEFITSLMTPAQIDEARKKASSWLTMRKHPATLSATISAQSKQSNS